MLPGVAHGSEWNPAVVAKMAAWVESSLMLVRSKCEAYDADSMLGKSGKLSACFSCLNSLLNFKCI